MSRNIELVCPHCDAVNRVLADRLGEAPVCGQCRQPLLPAVPITLHAGNFDRHITRSGLPVLVDFWAPWCAPCRMMAPVIDQAARELGSRIRVAKLDTEAAGDIAARYAIRSIPTLAVFKDGRELRRQSGALAYPALLQWLREVPGALG